MATLQHNSPQSPFEEAVTSSLTPEAWTFRVYTCQQRHCEEHTPSETSQGGVIACESNTMKAAGQPHRDTHKSGQ